MFLVVCLKGINLPVLDDISCFGQKHMPNEWNVMGGGCSSCSDQQVSTCLSLTESVTLCPLSSHSHPNPECPADREPLFKDKVDRKWHHNRDQVVINYWLIIDQLLKLPCLCFRSSETFAAIGRSWHWRFTVAVKLMAVRSRWVCSRYLWEKQYVHTLLPWQQRILLSDWL